MYCLTEGLSDALEPRTTKILALSLLKGLSAGFLVLFTLSRLNFSLLLFCCSVVVSSFLAGGSADLSSASVLFSHLFSVPAAGVV